jgi:hypothetical protein
MALPRAQLSGTVRTNRLYRARDPSYWIILTFCLLETCEVAWLGGAVLSPDGSL